MKHKYFLFGVICLFVSTFFAQEKLVTFKNDLDDSKYSIKEVIPVVNQNNDNISLFFMNTKRVYGYLLNDNFQVIKKLSSEDRRRKYNTIIGYSVTDSLNYNLYLTNNKSNKFAGINFSFNGGNSLLNEFEFQNSNEKFVQTVTIKNSCYLISILSESSVLKIYKLDGISSPKPYSIDLKNEFFLGRDDDKVPLYSLFKIKSNGLFVGIETDKIEDDTPNSIEVVSEEKKLYIIDDKIVFTFDNNKNVTQILTINPMDYSYDIKSYQKPLLKIKPHQKKSNSFISDDKIFTIASTNDSLGFMIQDFKTRKVLKEFLVTKEDSITFKNTPIIQEGGVYDKYRELEGSRKFLRKLTSADLGISAYKQRDDYLITIGSKKEIKVGGGSGMMMPMGGFGGIPIASIGSANIFFNPTFYAYNSYSTTKSVHIKSLFDSDFNHVKGAIKDNSFDKIKNHSEPGNLLGGKTIFKYKNYFILGNYISKSKSYILKRFND
ncbi:hypothetical protein ACGK9U_02630 [Mariniflexile sp. HNIBRBA6329]|uniref:hypothetical protein n=1 Tax=Mariniflexile sp. HNIBRBA6329 TaxID=3373088 RepID=UPI003745F035